MKFLHNKKTVFLLLLLAVLIGCTPMIIHQLDERFGTPDTARYNNPTPPQKGAPEYWVAVVRPGRVIFEAEGVPMEVAKEALRLAAQKLPIQTKFVVRRDYVEA